MPRTDTGGKLPVLPGVVAGIATWLLGLLLTYTLAHILSSDTLLHHIENEPFEGTLYVYLLIHSWILEAINQSGEAIFAVIPILLLTGAGYLLGSRKHTYSGSRAEIGATVTVGYLSMVAITLLLPPPSTFTVDPVIPLVWAGLLFPAVFGSIGGKIAERA